jgi:hypothetical protein
MLVEVLGDVRHVEIRVAFIGELLELRVEGFLVTVSTDPSWCDRIVTTYSCKANFVPQVVEATDTILGIFEVVVLDKAETVGLH